MAIFVQLCTCDFMFQYSSVMLYLQILLTSSPLPLISELVHKLGNSCLLRGLMVGKGAKPLYFVT